MESTVHSNAPTPSSLMEMKPLSSHYTDVDPTIHPDAPQEQRYTTIGPSNPLMNNVKVDEEEYSKLNHDVHAKSMQSLHSEGYGKLQHPCIVFTTPQYQFATEGYSTLPLNSKYETQNEQSITHPGQISSPESSEDICYCHFVTSYNYFL